MDADELAHLGDALDELANASPELAELVDLHFFCGFSLGEIAELRGVSERTAQRDWRKARLVLHQLLATPTRPAPASPELVFGEAMQLAVQRLNEVLRGEGVPALTFDFADELLDAQSRRRRSA
jgi:hypothetical protein